MIFWSHYQNAYVTRDLDRALALIDQRYGVREFVQADVELDLKTPSGAQKMGMRLAYAWVGRMQVELIQPQSGCIQHYVDSLPEDPADYSPRFNHIALRRDDRDEMRSEIASLNLPILFEGGFEGGLCFMYVDARKDLGHLLEYVWATTEMWQMLGWPS
jgi:hypothetical protein